MRKGDVATIKANHVLGLPLTISTRRVESITSKPMVPNEALVLAKSRLEEGSKNPEDLTLKSHEEWAVLLQEYPLTLKKTLLRNMG